jgi:hypothetical protein
MIVVADTSPLNYLVLRGHIEILAKIYAEIVVPQTVLDELQDRDAPSEVRSWFSTPPATTQALENAEMPFRQSSRTGRRPVGSGPHCREDGELCLGATRGGRRYSVSGMDGSRPSKAYQICRAQDDKDPAKIVNET